MRGVLVGEEENKAARVIDCIKYGFIYTKLKMLVKDISGKLPDVDRFKKVYTRLAYMIDYDEEVVDRSSEYSRENRRPARNMENAVLLNKAVCLGFAETLKQALSLVGIKSRVIKSMYNDEGQGHAYNLVDIDGTWYNADLTWDYQFIRRSIRPKFCLKSDRDFFKCDFLDRPNHRPDLDKNKVPKCNKSLEIYPELEPVQSSVQRLNSRIRKKFSMLYRGKRLSFPLKGNVEFRRRIRVVISSNTQVINQRGGYVGKHFSGKRNNQNSQKKDYTK